MKFSIYFMALAASAIGIVISSYLVTIIDLPELINAIFWFLISFTTYFFAKKVKEYSWFKMLSLDFFLTWAFVSIGVIIGVMIMQLIKTGSVTAELDVLTEVFFNTLPLALGPAATTSLGLRD